MNLANNKFVVDSQGNVKFAGHLEGATGSFSTLGIVDGVEQKVEIGNGRIYVSSDLDSGYWESEVSPWGLGIAFPGYFDDKEYVIYHHHFGIDLGRVDYEDGYPVIGSSIAGMDFFTDGYVRIYAYEGNKWLDIDVRATTIRGSLYIKNELNNPSEIYSLAVDYDTKIGRNLDVFGKVYVDNDIIAGTITAGTSSGYINLRPGNEHGYIEFHRSSGRAAYVGINSANSAHFDIDGHGLTGNIRLRSLNVLVEQRLISPRTYEVTAQSPANVLVTSSGYLARSTSSKRYKADIRYCDVDYKKILKLQQASWVDRSEYENNDMSAEGLKRYYGAIAEDFERIGLSEYVVYNEETGEVENFSDRAWVLLIPNINDILEELEQLKERLKRLENEGN